jgi:hypothetical protein
MQAVPLSGNEAFRRNRAQIIFDLDQGNRTSALLTPIYFSRAAWQYSRYSLAQCVERKCLGNKVTTAGFLGKTELRSRT